MSNTDGPYTMIWRKVNDHLEDRLRLYNTGPHNDRTYFYNLGQAANAVHEEYETVIKIAIACGFTYMTTDGWGIDQLLSRWQAPFGAYKLDAELASFEQETH